MNANAIQRVLDDKRKREQRSRLAREESERLARLSTEQAEAKAEAERVECEAVERARDQVLADAYAKTTAAGTIKARVEYAKLKREMGRT